MKLYSLLFFWRFLAAFSLVILTTPSILFAQFEEGNKHVSIKLVSELSSMQPALDESQKNIYKVGIYFTIEPGWHIYWRNSGEAAVPTNIEWQLPEGWTIENIHWPIPEKITERGDIRTYAYRDETLIFADLIPPHTADDPTITFKADISWLVCKEICVPGKKSTQREFPFSKEIPLEPSSDFPLFEKFKRSVPKEPITALHELKINPYIASVADKHFLMFSFESDTALETLQNAIQIFPYQSDSLIAQKFFIAKDANVVYLFAPLTSDTSLSGEIALSKELLSIGGDTVFFWEAKKTTQMSAAPTIVEKNNAELLYKVHDASTVLHQEAEVNTSLLFSLLSAFIGGLILNLMPCVLPIISIKLMSFVSNSGANRHETYASAIFFTLGVTLSFLTLAGIVIILRTAGIELGWGFQFQYPAFVVSLTFLVFFLSLGFFDLYKIPMPKLKWANKTLNELETPHLKHILDGILTTLLSTPCTAPFLGAALLFAFTSTALETIAIFLAISLGLSLPYVLISTSPRLIALLPKPGPWMSWVRKVMGLALLATVAWLLFVLNEQTESGMTAALVLLALLFILFLIHKKLRLHSALAIICSLSLFTFTLSFSWPLLVEKRTTSALTLSGDWQAYSEEKILTALGQGQAVFLDFTAAWCITCKANERLVLDDAEVLSLFKSHNVLLLKADWTNADPIVTEALYSYGARGVPLYVLLTPQKKPLVLPTLLTKSIIFDSLASM